MAPKQAIPVFSNLTVRIHDWHTRRKMNRLFGRRTDPYRYETSPYEIARISGVMDALAGCSGDILELGCGEGVITERLAAQFSRVTALDVSGLAIERARRRLNSSTNVSFVLGNARDWVRTATGTFDVILMSEVLYYLGELNQKGDLWEAGFQAFLSDAVSLLRDGGTMLLVHGFGTPFERSVRQAYGDRLVRIGMALEDRQVVATGPHDKGTMQCLVDRLVKRPQNPKASESRCVAPSEPSEARA